MVDGRHDDLRDLVAAYVLDAVTPHEAAQVEAHLAVCADCRSLERELREAAAALADLAAEMTPSPGLKARLMDSVTAEGHGRVDRLDGDKASHVPGPEAPAPTPDIPLPSPGANGHALRRTTRTPRLRRDLRRVPPLLALAAAVVLVVLGIGLWRLVGSGQPAPTRQYAMAGTVVQPAITGTLRYFKDGARVELDVHGLKPIPPGRVYELWLIRGHYRLVTGVGTFRPAQNGSARRTWRGEDVPGYTLACLTVEQGPRASRPTMPLVAVAQITG